MTDNTHNDLTLEELSARREKLGLSVADMANRIKVSREIIHFIEQGEFNRIGSATFIRGHVGNYARELKLDPQIIIAMVPEQHLKPYEPKLSTHRATNPLSRVKTQSSGFGRYVLGTFLVAALGVSVYFVYDKWDNNQADAVNQTALNDDSMNTGTESKQKKVIYSSLLPQAELIQDNNSDVNQSVSPDNQDEGTNLDFEDPSEPQPQDNTDEPVSVSDESAVLESSTDETLNQHLYNIRFDLTEQAWVSIKTESGETVVSDLIGPGERSYGADEPVNFRIGNANQLRLTINGQTVDLTASTRKNVANFSWPLPDS